MDAQLPGSSRIEASWGQSPLPCTCLLQHDREKEIREGSGSVHSTSTVQVQNQSISNKCHTTKQNRPD